MKTNPSYLSNSLVFLQITRATLFLTIIHKQCRDNANKLRTSSHINRIRLISFHSRETRPGNLAIIAMNPLIARNSHDGDRGGKSVEIARPASQSGFIIKTAFRSSN